MNQMIVSAGPQTAAYTPGNSPSPIPAKATLLNIYDHPIATYEDLRNLVVKNAIRHEIHVAPVVSGFMPFLHPDEVALRKRQDFFIGDGRFIAARHVRLIRAVSKDALRRAVNARVAAYKDLCKRPLTQNQIEIFQFEEEQRLLPTAPVLEREELLVVDLLRRTGFIETGSFSAAQKISLRFERYQEDDTPLPLYAPSCNLEHILTDWTTGNRELPDGFMLGRRASMSGENNERAVVSNHELVARPVQNHIEAGMAVLKLELHWQDKLTIQVDQSGSFSSIRYATSPTRKKGLSKMSRADMQEAFLAVIPDVFEALDAYQSEINRIAESMQRPAGALPALPPPPATARQDEDWDAAESGAEHYA